MQRKLSRQDYGSRMTERTDAHCLHLLLASVHVMDRYAVRPMSFVCYLKTHDVSEARCGQELASSSGPNILSCNFCV
jgi:hypothetical protein